VQSAALKEKILEATATLEVLQRQQMTLRDVRARLRTAAS
jgi:hypothetical protein